MPKEIINYSSTIIYKLVCKDLNITDIYVGHTTNFIKRKANHKSNCNNPNKKAYNFKIYSTIRDNGNWDNWDMIEIEKYNCNDKNEAFSRERYWYENLQAKLNMRYPNQTFKEYCSKNKEKLLLKSKEYCDKNKEKRSQIYDCKICGKTYTHTHKTRHEKSEFHMNKLEKK
jgi:hypothetical protein